MFSNGHKNKMKGFNKYRSQLGNFLGTFLAGRCADEGTAGPISDTLCHSQCGPPAHGSPLHYM